MIFLVSAKYVEPVEGEDSFKTVNAKYVVDAVSVTDSEAKLIGWLPTNYQDKEIIGSVISNINEVIAVNYNEETDVFYFGRASYLEERGSKKVRLVKRTVTFLVNGKPNNLEEALSNAVKYYKLINTIDYTIESIAASKMICDSDLATIDNKSV